MTREHDSQVETFGAAGTVVLWHHRLCHAPSPNYSDTVRLAALYDFVQARRPQLPQADI